MNAFRELIFPYFLPHNIDKKDHRNGIKRVRRHRHRSMKGVSRSLNLLVLHFAPIYLG
jgi:hypothetical protein